MSSEPVEAVEWAQVSFAAAPKLLAKEIRRINAQGGTWRKDELAKLLYNEASPMHDWDNMKPWGGMGVPERREMWRRVADTVDGMLDEMFPSAEAVDAADVVVKAGAKPSKGGAA